MSVCDNHDHSGGIRIGWSLKLDSTGGCLRRQSQCGCCWVVYCLCCSWWCCCSTPDWTPCWWVPLRGCWPGKICCLGWPAAGELSAMIGVSVRPPGNNNSRLHLNILIGGRLLELCTVHAVSEGVNYSDLKIIMFSPANFGGSRHTGLLYKG